MKLIIENKLKNKLENKLKNINILFSCRERIGYINICFILLYIIAREFPRAPVCNPDALDNWKRAKLIA